MFCVPVVTEAWSIWFPVDVSAHLICRWISNVNKSPSLSKHNGHIFWIADDACNSEDRSSVKIQGIWSFRKSGGLNSRCSLFDLATAIVHEALVCSQNRKNLRRWIVGMFHRTSKSRRNFYIIKRRQNGQRDGKTSFEVCYIFPLLENIHLSNGLFTLVPGNRKFNACLTSKRSGFKGTVAAPA